jgi:sulfur carrier protein ThiS
VLDALDIAPSTVLAVHDGTIVPHDSKINGDIHLELITVSSGG